MIPYIDNIEATKLPDGGTKFEITGDNGLYELVFDKEIKMFELTTPDSWTESLGYETPNKYYKQYQKVS